jgi:hypothetical protein
METTWANHEWRAVADEIWAMIREDRKGFEKLKKNQEETGRDFQKIKESQEEIDRLIKETAQQMKETDRKIGKLGNRFGEVVEFIIRPNLVSQFQELGFEFTRAGPDVKITDPKHGIDLEIDAFLENGDKVMIVEIKSKPNTDDVNEHIERMEKLRKYADLRGDKRIYLGAVAGIIFGGSEKAYALKKGFYVIETTGETLTITEPKGKNHPHEW